MDGLGTTKMGCKADPPVKVRERQSPQNDPLRAAAWGMRIGRKRHRIDEGQKGGPNAIQDFDRRSASTPEGTPSYPRPHPPIESAPPQIVPPVATRAGKHWEKCRLLTGGIERFSSPLNQSGGLLRYGAQKGTRCDCGILTGNCDWVLPGVPVIRVVAREGFTDIVSVEYREVSRCCVLEA